MVAGEETRSFWSLPFIQFLTVQWVLGCFFFPLLHVPSSPAWLGRCHCLRSVIGCQTTHTHWGMVSFLVFLPFALPCIHKAHSQCSVTETFPSSLKLLFLKQTEKSYRVEVLYRDLEHSFPFEVRCSGSLSLGKCTVQEGRKSRKQNAEVVQQIL